MHQNELFNQFLHCKTVTTDSRAITENCIFIALKGEKFNGNLFAKQALELGAKIVVVDDSTVYDTLPQKQAILVSDGLKALQDLANEYRRFLNIPIVGITGSNGKTTTKELLNSVLNTWLPTFVTPGNFNNHIGLPLSILRIEAHHKLAILEMGDNKPRDIHELCEIAEPNYGIITNVGLDHIEGYGSYEANVQTKNELFQYISASNGTVFYDANDEQVASLAKSINNKITYPEIEINSKELFLNYTYKNQIGKTQLIGAYNAQNIRTAIAVAERFLVPPEKIIQAIADYTPSNNRSQLIEKSQNKVILDAYNANPSSVELALENLKNLSYQTKVVVLGDMLELGAISDKEHLRIGQLAESIAQKVILVGPQYKRLSFKAALQFEGNCPELQELLKTLTNSLILLKGSRGLKMEQYLEFIA